MTENLHGTRVSYEIQGEGTSRVILLHGWGCDQNMMQPVADALKDEHQVLLVDFPGHGKSGRPPEPWGVPEYAECLEELLDRTGFTPCSVIAHSFGCRVAAWAASEWPELFTRRIMDHFGLSPYFAHICAAPMDESDGGKKENVIAAALRLASDPAGAVMVGDRSYDIIGAHKNAIPAIGVLYGYGSREELEKAGADRTADSVASLGELLHDTI